MSVPNDAAATDGALDTDGGTVLADTGCTLKNTGERTPSGATNLVDGDTGWANILSARVADNVFGGTSLWDGRPESTLIMYKGFDFPVPAGAQILGVTARVTRRSDGPRVRDGVVKLAKAGSVVGASRSGTGAWPLLVGGDVVYGGASDLWGAATIDANFVNSPDFGLGFSARFEGFGPVERPEVDGVAVTIYYCE